MRQYSIPIHYRRAGLSDLRRSARSPVVCRGSGTSPRTGAACGSSKRQTPGAKNGGIAGCGLHRRGPTAALRFRRRTRTCRGAANSQAVWRSHRSVQRGTGDRERVHRWAPRYVYDTECPTASRRPTHTTLLPQQVLIVDDNADSAGWVGLLVRPWGHEVGHCVRWGRRIRAGGRLSPRHTASGYRVDQA